MSWLYLISLTVASEIWIIFYPSENTLFRLWCSTHHGKETLYSRRSVLMSGLTSYWYPIYKSIKFSLQISALFSLYIYLWNILRTAVLSLLLPSVELFVFQSPLSRLTSHGNANGDSRIRNQPPWPSIILQEKYNFWRFQQLTIGVVNVSVGLYSNVSVTDFEGWKFISSACKRASVRAIYWICSQNIES